MQEKWHTISKDEVKTSAWWALAFLACFLLLMALWRPWQKITTVTVDSGNIPTETIEKQMGLKEGAYRYQVVLQEGFLAQKIIHQNNKVSEAKLQLSQTTLKVTVAEKINAGFIQEKGRWYQLDSNGNRRLVKEPDGRGPVYSDFQSNDRVKKVAKQVASLDKVIRQDIGEIRFAPDSKNDSKLILIMDDGNTVYATQKTLSEKMRYYAGIAQSMSEPGIIDLQIGSYSYNYGS
ncbi:cell division protein FtsQ/DivIB [Fructobacillus sp. M1-13]|uniref:Cell division protein FtsQ n=1 Tax=Fructobacillus papyriferae TaxID=2713171 RepID=A0ABS5QN44_9LACO|nr:cell division protein FtsQ/DivIB [Fructobacillus papyriferae]MBS9334504.1 cell division protein FtsQ [Fructobacillus papyriferae]MCD2158493.1 cell division protein FtsQ/DivIB [Fructobacillus papyriferae]